MFIQVKYSVAEYIMSELGNSTNFLLYNKGGV